MSPEVPHFNSGDTLSAKALQMLSDGVRGANSFGPGSGVEKITVAGIHSSRVIQVATDQWIEIVGSPDADGFEDAYLLDWNNGTLEFERGERIWAFDVSQ